MLLRVIAIASVAACLTGCGAPFMHPLAQGSGSVRDTGLAGEWLSEGDTVTRAVITEIPEGKYSALLTVHHKGEFKTTVQVDLAIMDAGPNRYADLFLATPEREKLVNQYGFLVLPVHQIMKISRQDNELQVWSFDEDWLEKQATAAALPHDRFAIGGGEITVITAPAEQVRRLVESPDEPGKFSPPIVFRRVQK